MTNDEKAKAYEMALEAARKELGVDRKEWEAVGHVLLNIFPQLRESEDERIINQLITLVNSAGEVLLIPTNKEELVAWLNKCKESLHITETCKENDKSFTDESEDERIRNELINFLRSPFIKENLTDEKAAPWLDWLEKQKEQKHPNGCFTCDEYKKGYEAGRLNGFTAGYNKAMKEQKPAEWNPNYEDVILFNKAVTTNQNLTPSERAKLDIIRTKFKHCNGHIATSDFDLALGERYIQGYNDALEELKPAWNEEDQLNLNWVIAILNGEPCDLDIQLESLISWLRDLRPSWKPNEEQMKALEVAFRKDGDDKYRSTINSLYNDLKRL